MEVMVDLFESVLEFSYLGIFFLLILVNAAPLLMPPTWIILASFYAIDTSYDPLVLALVGATGATIGRFILKKVSTLFRKFVQKEQKSNLEAIGNFLNNVATFFRINLPIVAPVAPTNAKTRGSYDASMA